MSVCGADAAQALAMTVDVHADEVIAMGEENCANVRIHAMAG
jgi:hypothetical protein